ncbi:unnamed protein product [Brassica oleracea]|uniref:Uncharacterized protein n=1 Tax=Brassica oleracea TaxID=3712 RepID=A0A3P6EIJ3_BRAOL|nr:unnamed protein product [Brassica oleracea]
MHVELEIFLFLSWYLHPSGVEKNQNLLQLQLVILELGLNSFI